MTRNEWIGGLVDWWIGGLVDWWIGGFADSRMISRQSSALKKFDSQRKVPRKIVLAF